MKKQDAKERRSDRRRFRIEKLEERIAPANAAIPDVELVQVVVPEGVCKVLPANLNVPVNFDCSR